MPLSVALNVMFSTPIVRHCAREYLPKLETDAFLHFQRWIHNLSSLNGPIQRAHQSWDMQPQIKTTAQSYRGTQLVSRADYNLQYTSIVPALQSKGWLWDLTITAALVSFHHFFVCLFYLWVRLTDCTNRSSGKAISWIMWSVDLASFSTLHLVQGLTHNHKNFPLTRKTMNILLETMFCCSCVIRDNGVKKRGKNNNAYNSGHAAIECGEKKHSSGDDWPT